MPNRIQPADGLLKSWKPIKRSFFDQPPEIVAPLLLGKLLCSQTTAGWLSGRIVEVEAYLGPHALPADPAAHSFRGITERNRVMFGQSGHAYVYFIYGMHFCVNVTCEPVGKAGCILIRALEPVQGREAMTENRKLLPNSSDTNLTRGPGRLCQALGITRPIHNGLDLLDPGSILQLRQDRFNVDQIEITPRIGIRQAADLRLRFSIANHPCVSRPSTMKPV